MKVKTHAQYLSRYRQRAPKRFSKRNFRANIGHRLDQMCWMVDYGSYKQKPQHELRFHNITDCFPRIKQAT